MMDLNKQSDEKKMYDKDEIISCIYDIVGSDFVDLDKGFNENGFESLPAVSFKNALNAQGFQCTLATIFSLTIRQLATQLETGLHMAEQPSKVTPSNYVDKLLPILPLSHRQSRLWFLQFYDQIGDVYNYNEQIIVKLKGKVNYRLLGQAWMAITQEQTMLRTKFVDDRVKQGQVVLSATENYFNTNPMRGKLADEHMLDLRLQKFDLLEKSPQRLAIFQTDDETTWFVLTQHHIITDGASLSLIVKKLSKYYTQLLETGELSPSKLTYHYADYALWENEQLRSTTINKQVEEWKQRLNLDQTKAELPLDKFDNTVSQGALNEPFRIDSCLVKKLKSAAESTAFTVLLSTFVRTMFKFCRQDTMLVSVPFANRNFSQIEDIIGFFTATCLLPFNRNSIHLVSLINYVKQLVSEETDQSLAFEKLLKRDQFNVMFVLQTGVDLNFEIKGIQSSYFQRECVAKCDWHMWINVIDGEYHCSLIHRKGLFYSETVRTFINMYLQEIYDAAECLTNRSVNIPTLDPVAAERMVQGQKLQPTDYPHDFTLVQAFVNQTKRTPSNVAYECDGEKVTYSRLCAMAQGAAAELKKKMLCTYNIKIMPNNVCVIKSDNNPNILLDILTCHFANLAYLPIDSKYPPKRVEFMCQDSGAIVFIGEDDARVPADIPRFCRHEDNWLVKPEMDNNIYPDPQDLAYVMYTSGTSGTPKGVPVPHGRLGSLIQAITSTLHLSDHSCLLQLFRFSFDSSFTDISVLANGGSLILNKDPTRLIEALNENPHVTGLSATPALFSMLEKEELEKLKQLEFVCYMGETMQQKTLDDLLMTGCPVFQGYGPTEATVVVALKRMKLGDKSNNIGKSRVGCSLSIVNQENEICPVGTIGELCITGDCLARGYLNLPEKTLKSFEPVFFQSRKSATKTENQLQYRTGDLAKLSFDGNISLLGRIDSQVKVRGFRVELEEIEAILNNYDGVKTSVVRLHVLPNTTKSALVAYYVPNIEKVDGGKLMDHLSEKLPEYMIPRIFVPIKVLPLTFNGKIDEQSLQQSLSNYFANKKGPKRRLSARVD